MTTFMPPPPAATFLAFHPQDNNIIAIGMDDSTIQIYNVRVDEVKSKLKGHSKRITGLAFSHVLNVLVSSGADAQVSSSSSICNVHSTPPIFNCIYYLQIYLISALCMEFWWMGEAKDKIPSASTWKNTNSTVRHTCTVSSWSDPFPCCTRDPTRNIRNNKTRMCKTGNNNN